MNTTTILATDTPRAHTTRVSWGAIFAGLFLALATYLFLGVLGTEMEEMGWGVKPAEIAPYLPPGAEFHALEGTGHFVHIEQPRRVADLSLDFLARR